MSALQELQNYTFVSKYARWVEDKNRRETWKEAVDRVKSMMHFKYPEAKEWYMLLKSRPSFRALLQDQVPGHQAVEHYAVLDF